MFNIQSRKFRLVIILLLTIISLYFIYRIKIVLIPFLLGIILAYLFNPFVEVLRKKGFSRQGSLFLILIFILVIIVYSGLILFPHFIKEMENLSKSIPMIVNSAEDYINFVHTEFERLSLPVIIKNSLQDSLIKIENYIVNLIESTTELIINSLSSIFIILISPIITYYILRDITLIKKSFIRLFPMEQRKFCYITMQEINKIFIGFLRGQIWISIIVGILSALGLYLLHVRFYLLLGLLTGITNIIPYIGPIIGSLPAVMIACLSSPLRALAVILLFVLIQQIEGVFIAPRILSKNIGLHPLTVIFSLLAGAELFGIWGLIFSLPFVGSLKVLAGLINEHYSLLIEQ